MAKLKAKEIAQYFLGTVDEESGDNITNLKLQKLLYYAQGFYVAMNGESLFDDPIEAWDLGPVVPNVYQGAKGHRAEPIPRPENFDITDYPPELVEFLDAVILTYGQFSAWKLSEMTHREPPWKETYQPNRNVEINLGSLEEFFSRRVEAGRRKETLEGEPVWPTESFQFQRRLEFSRRMDPHRERLRLIARKIQSAELKTAVDVDD